MKKLLTMLFLVAFAWTSYAQLSTEGFNGVTFPPAGWTTTPAASDGHLLFYHLCGEVLLVQLVNNIVKPNDSKIIALFMCF